MKEEEGKFDKREMHFFEEGLRRKKKEVRSEINVLEGMKEKKEKKTFFHEL